ncbi:ferric reductase like transmembrane component-domain-containing protein [Mariannaea sp. PMI_226]|nr:ferric reductase like transmembrane component-domain-containing protein [Mariannaea sp. PMI_226]
MRLMATPLNLLLLSLLAIISSGGVVTASPGLTCYLACEKTLGLVRFDDGDGNGIAVGLNKTCRSLRGLTSLYLCLDVYCTPEAIDAGLGPLNETCLQGAAVSIPSYAAVVEKFAAGDIDKLRRIEWEESQRSPVFSEVVLPSKTHFGYWWDTLDSVFYVNYHHHLYGAAMNIFWAAVIAVGVTSRLISAIPTSRLGQRKSPRASGKLSFLSSWFKGAITLPATFGDRCAQKIGWGTVPPRIQSLTLVAFLILNIVLSVIGYRIVPVNLYFETKFRQGLRYVSDRTGVISFANFPLIWLFGMRNNVLMWLTGWDFGTYNNFHRWVARIATVQAIVHSIGYTILVIDEGGWSAFVNWWTYLFWWTGEVATIVMSAIILFSFYWIRRQQYEMFLILHIGMSILLLAFMLLHVSIFQGEYDILFWVPLFIWVVDRVLRALRIVAFNPYFWNTRASASYNPSSNIIRVSVPWATSIYKPAPGTFYYLHVLNGPRCWESHPFTVATVSDHGETSAKLLSEQMPLLESTDDHVDTIANPSGTDGDDEASYSPTMTFLIRPYDGFTSRLKDVAASSWPSKTPLRVLVDGPYGHTQSFHLFDNVVFIVAGSGIVVALSYLQVLVNARLPQASPKSVHIHWAVREPHFALDVLQTDVGDIFASSTNLSITIHLTQEAHDSHNWPSQVHVQPGRIDTPSVIATAHEKAQDDSLAVIACGPAQMADAARKTVAGMLRLGATRIEYFEESFQW